MLTANNPAGEGFAILKLRDLESYFSGTNGLCFSRVKVAGVEEGGSSSFD